MSGAVTPDEGHPRRWFILAIMGMSLIVVMLNNVTLNVACLNSRRTSEPTMPIYSGFLTRMPSFLVDLS